MKPVMRSVGYNTIDFPITYIFFFAEESAKAGLESLLLLSSSAHIAVRTNHSAAHT